jgi:hypothetical protein
VRWRRSKVQRRPSPICFRESRKSFGQESGRLIHALISLGKPAALFMYPYESHSQRAVENVMDQWARWLGWFDRYVKNARTASQ